VFRELLLAVARGGSSFPVVYNREVRTITAAPDGAWSWFGDPRAVYYNGYTYVGYVDTTGNVCVRWFRHSDSTVGSEIILKAALDVDDHVNPSFLVRASDHKLMVWYCRHEPISTTMHQRISTTSLDTDPDLGDGFAAETDTDAQMGSVSYDYPVPIQLSSDSPNLRMFYRNVSFGSDYQITQSESPTAAGTDWSGRDAVYRSNHASGRGYWKIADDGAGKIHFAVTNESPNTGATSLGHAYFDTADGDYHQTDGTVIALRGVAPLDVFWFIDVTLVYDGSVTRGWVWDIALDGATPVIVYPTFPGYTGSGVASDHRYNYARWNGSAWVSTEICAAGPGIDVTGVYSGGMCLDPDDPSIVYASRQVASRWGIWKYVTADNGATFSGTLISDHATEKLIRPYVPKGHAQGLDVLWLQGAYTGYTVFNMGIRAYG
jgi:hypothetical protein